MKQLKDNIYYVGVINPNLRVFDIIMKTEYGTSYNAYLIKGEKTALVETVHDRFSEHYFDNIKQITPIEDIDYIIFNHTEPDHSGSLMKLLKINPKIKVVGTTAAIKNLNAITNSTFESIPVKTGDTLDLGNDMLLEFIASPNLHWPDTIRITSYNVCYTKLLRLLKLLVRFCRYMIILKERYNQKQQMKTSKKA